jgi:hypothetical protein
MGATPGSTAGGIFVLAIMILIIIGGALKVYLTWFFPRHFSFGPVNPSGLDYDKKPTKDAGDDRDFRASRQEAEAEARPEAARGSAGGIVSFTEKALQSRDADRDAATYERAAVEVFAALLKAGYLESAVSSRKIGAAKQLIFGVSGGRKLQALNDAIDAVDVPTSPEPAPPAAPPEPPRVVKVNAGRPDEREVPLQMEPAP